MGETNVKDRTWIGNGRGLLVVLTILPLILLLWQAREEDRRVAAEADRRWLAATNPVAGHIGQASRLPFWMEWAARRCRLWTVRDLKRRRTFPQAADRGIREARLPGLPDLQAWVVEFPDGDLEREPRSLSGPFLATTSRRMVAGILRTAAQSHAGSRGVPSRSVVEGLFGVGTNPELFTGPSRGAAFHVVHGRQSAMAAWDLILDGKKCRGAFLLMMPLTLGDRQTPLRATLANWRRMVRTPGLLPAFMPLPGAPGPVKGKILTVSGRKGRRVARALEAWRHRPRINQGMAADLERLRSLLRPDLEVDPQAIGRQLTGSMHLGGFQGGLVERLPGTGLRVRLAHLSPLAGRIGLLLGPEEKPRLTWQRCAVIAWAAGVGAVWGMGLLLPFLGISLGSSGVRRELSAWFAGLAVIPLTLTIVAAIRYQNDLRINLTEGLRDELLEEFAGLEAGANRLSDRYQSIFREISSRPNLVPLVNAIESGVASADPFLEGVMRECRHRGADPVGILLASCDGFVRSRYLPWVPVVRREMTSMVYEVLGKSYFDLKFVKPPAFRSPKAKKSRSVMLSQVMARMAELRNNAMKWGQADRRTSFSTGGKSTMQYHRLLFEGPLQIGALIFLWDQDRVYRRFLSREVPLLARRRGLTMAAFRLRENNLILMAGGGEDNLRESLRLVARQARDLPALVSRDEALIVAAPIRQMPQFVLAAAIPQEKVRRRLELERRRILGMIGGLLCLLAAAAWGLSIWLVHPLLVMDRGLRRVAGGNLRLQLEINREDELGEAGVTLDQMTSWLRERQRMSRFVAPQVLEAVAAGASEKTGQGQLCRAVMLVSDIRSFTGISETHTPREVFALLNHHLERMTQVIQQWGGTIDRFIGDAIQAVFFESGSRTPESRALSAARAMMRVHRELNGERIALGGFPYEIGIGLASGTMVAGIVGDPAHRLDFTVLGEALKEAGELEASSKAGRSSRIICSDAVCRALPRNLTFLPIQGRTGAWELEERPDASEHVQELDPAVAATPRFPDPAKGNPQHLAEDGRAAAVVCSRQPWREPLPNWFLPLVFWLLPVFMVTGALRWLEISRRENAERRTLERTREAASLIGQTVDPAFHVSQYLNGEMREGLKSSSLAKSPGPDGFRRVSDAALARALTPRLRRLERFFGRARWAVFGHDPRLDRDPQVKTHRSAKFLAKGGEPWVPPISPRDLERLFSIYHTQVVGGTPGGEIEVFMRQKLERWLGGNARYMDVTVQRSCGNLVRQSTSDGIRFSYWYPLLASDTLELTFPDDLERSTVGPGLELWDTIQGGVLLDIPPESLSRDLVMRAMIRRFRREGFALAFLGTLADPLERKGDRVWRDPEFSRDPELRGFSRMTEMTRIGVEWIAVRGIFPQEFGGEFILARRLSTDVVRTEAVRPWVWKTLIVLWVVGGMVLLVRQAYGTLGRIRLAVRLIGAFTVVLLPVLVVGGLTLERSGIEQRSRSERELKRRLDAFLQVIDEDNQLYSAQQCAILSRLTRNQDFRKAILEDERFGRWSVINREKGKASIIHPTDARRMFEAFPPLAAAYWSLIACGVSPNTTLVANAEEYSRYYPTILDKEGAGLTLYLFSDLFSQTLGRMAMGEDGAENKERQRRRLMAGAKFEEMRDIFSLVFSPEVFGEITAAPETFFEMLAGDVSHKVYRAFLETQGKPRFVFQVTWNPRAVIWNQLNDRIRMGPRRGKRFSEAETGFVALVSQEEPIFQFAAPFGAFAFQYEKGDCVLKNSNTLIPGAFRDLTGQAALSGLAVGTRIYPAGSGEEGDLVRVFPGRFLERKLLVGISPVGQILHAARLQMTQVRWFLLGLLVLTVLLARSVAHRLLEPIRALTVGARRIMSGDFTVRLRIERSDELGRLATAFNSMAKGVEEGERLSRFVSDSVRKAARNEEHEQEALEGVACEAVVVFAGLPSFKERLLRQDPVELIGDLNRHLQMLAKLIRATGGEIDKFVGDRILAVFHLSRFGSREATVRAALTAAEEMRFAAVGPEAPFRQPLGVGLVFGSVLAGIMGTEAVRLEYTVIGDTVNLASRLCDLAGSLPGGGIILDSRMAQLAQGLGTIGQLTIRRVKGKSREVEVFRFEGKE